MSKPQLKIINCEGRSSGFAMYELKRAYEKCKGKEDRFSKSVVRLYWAYENSNNQSKPLNLTTNLDYYKEHGRLPDNVDMQKIRGKA